MYHFPVLRHFYLLLTISVQSLPSKFWHFSATILTNYLAIWNSSYLWRIPSCLVVYVSPLLQRPLCQGWHSWSLQRELKESKISKCKSKLVHVWYFQHNVFLCEQVKDVLSPDSLISTVTFLSGTFDHQTSLNFAPILFKLTALEILIPTFAVLFQDKATVK